MQKSAEMPFTITIRKNITSGKKITFSGWRARIFAREMLESTMLLNRTATEEKKEIPRMLSRVIESGERLIEAGPEEKENARWTYRQNLHLFYLSCQVLHLKLMGERYTGTGLPEKVAQQLIIDEHLPNLLGKVSAIGDLLHMEVSGNNVKKAEKWLRALKGDYDQINALSKLLDNLATNNFWEIKALAEQFCTSAALHKAGVKSGTDTKKTEAVRDSASPTED